MTHSPDSPATCAILFAAWPGQAVARTAHEPGSLSPLLGKPLLQRALERLVEHGLRQIRVVVGDNAGAVRALLGNGEAWGCQLAYHYLPPAQAPLPRLGNFLATLGVQADGSYWLADGSVLPPAALAASALPASGGQLSWASGGRLHWSGWGCFPGSWLLAAGRPLARSALARQVLADAQLPCRVMAPPLAADSAAALLQAARRLLAETAAPPLHRSCQVHPSARLVAPVWIGRHVHIGAGAVVGPHAVIGAGTFIDCDSVVCDALVLPETFLGARLEVRTAVVAGPRLHSVRHGCVSTVNEPWLLADLARPPRRQPLERALAGLLWLLLAPLGWLAARRPGLWSSDFVQRFRPGLALVWRGQLRLAGPPPGHAATDAGLLEEALLLLPSERDSATCYASAMLAAARQDQLRYALALVARYLQCVLRDLFSPAAWRRARPATNQRT